MKRNVGRPIVENKRNREIRIRVNDNEYEIFNEYSKISGMPLSKFVRGSVLFYIRFHFVLRFGISRILKDSK